METFATYLPPPTVTHEVNEHTPPQQRPTMFWIGCCDARASEARALPGIEIFVHRNIANQFPLSDGNAMASLAHAVSLNTIVEIRVVGHTDCGGVIASHDSARGHPPNLHWSLWNWLEALTIVANKNPSITVRQLTELNVRLQVENVRSVLGKLTNRTLRLSGYVYDIAANRLEEIV